MWQTMKKCVGIRNSESTSIKACTKGQKWTELNSLCTLHEVNGNEMNWTELNCQFSSVQFSSLCTVRAKHMKWTELHWHISVQFLHLVHSLDATGSVHFCRYVHAFMLQIITIYYKLICTYEVRSGSVIVWLSRQATIRVLPVCLSILYCIPNSNTNKCPAVARGSRPYCLHPRRPVNVT